MTLTKSNCNKCKKEILVAYTVPVEEEEERKKITGIPAFAYPDGDINQGEERVHDLCWDCAWKFQASGKAGIAFSGIPGDAELIYTIE